MGVFVGGWVGGWVVGVGSLNYHDKSKLRASISPNWVCIARQSWLGTFDTHTNWPSPSHWLKFWVNADSRSVCGSYIIVLFKYEMGEKPGRTNTQEQLPKIA